jgi:hypothetical protein
MTEAHFFGNDPESTPAITIAEILVDKLSHEREAAAIAASVFDAASTCTNHPYLTAKGIKGHGIRQHKDNLLIPLRDSARTLHSLQAITPEGRTQLLPNGRVKGCFHAINGKPDVLLICESYATGASLHEATGSAVAIAINADNLELVARDLRSRYPEVTIAIAANDDHQIDGNPGLTNAKAAAMAVGGVVVVPDFGASRPVSATDFNDLHKYLGLEAVKHCVEAAISLLPSITSIPAPTFEPVEAIDNHRNLPRPDPTCLYGLVGDIAQAGSNSTEANAYAVAASALAYISAALGRGPYFPIGDDANHARLFMVHVGRTSRGRKGTSKKLIKRIHDTLMKNGGTLAPQVHSGGLSTREGLALLIHDGFRDGKREIPSIDDKRLFVIESEFSNVMHQSKRDGNTLSGALRDVWDGTSIKPAVKNSPVWASDPHIAIMADVTPSELQELMHKRELTNGFANRFIFFWAEGDKVEPFPQPTSTQVIESLANRVAQVLQFAGADNHQSKDVIRMEFAPDAASLYESLYRGELRDRSAGEKITGLLDRRAPILVRLAMLFALTDQTHIITVDHLNAAMAWVRYWADSVKFIFQSSNDEAGAALAADVARRITTYLNNHGQATRTELSKDCFGGHTSKAMLDKALDELITASPPAIEVKTLPRPQGQAGSPTKVYKLCKPSPVPASTANCANSAKSQPTPELTADTERIPTEQAKDVN